MPFAIAQPSALTVDADGAAAQVMEGASRVEAGTATSFSAITVSTFVGTFRKLWLLSKQLQQIGDSEQLFDSWCQVSQFQHTQTAIDR